MSIVHEDSHSLYVIANGSVIRPVPSIVDFGNGPNITKGPVLFNKEWRMVGDLPISVTLNDNVKVKMIGNSPYYLVNGQEVWTTHGQRHYYDSEAKKLIRNDTEDCWRVYAKYDTKIDAGHI